MSARYRATTAPTLFVLALVAFAPPAHSAPATSGGAQSVSASILVAPNRNDRLLAVAEGFEALTENAFSGSLDHLKATHVGAASDVAIIATDLSHDDRRRLEILHESILSALRDRDRSALALAAVESYRVLVSAQDARAAVPVEVGLLDYAGFKLEALVKADVVRWDDMARVLDDADSQWKALSPRVSSRPLAGALQTTLAGMRRAIRARNALAASVASSDELALVDLLEEHFLKR